MAISRVAGVNSMNTINVRYFHSISGTGYRKLIIFIEFFSTPYCFLNSRAPFYSSNQALFSFYYIV